MQETETVQLDDNVGGPETTATTTATTLLRPDVRAASSVSMSGVFMSPSGNVTKENSAFIIKSKRVRVVPIYNDHVQQEWNIMIPRLQQFYKAFGHSVVTAPAWEYRPPMDDITTNEYDEYDDHDDHDDSIRRQHLKELDSWSTHLRTEYRSPDRKRLDQRKRLSTHQFQQLEAVDFVWNLRHVEWYSRLTELRNYYEQTGHCCVIPADEGSGAVTLGMTKWLSRQRCEYREWLLTMQEDRARAIDANSIKNSTNNRNNVTTTSNILPAPQRWQALERLDPNWFVVAPAYRRFPSMMDRLENYFQQHGHSDVTQDDTHHVLYQWTRAIRDTFVPYSHDEYEASVELGLSSLSSPVSRHSSQNKVMLSKERTQQLESVGFIWTIEKVGKGRKHPFKSVTKSTTHSDGGGHRRRRHLPASLTKKQESWHDRYQQLVAFYQLYGHTNPSQRAHKAPRELVAWCNEQRRAYKQKRAGQTGASANRLRPGRIARLEQLNFAWNRQDQHWQDMMMNLRAFYKNHGHTAVPEDDADVKLYRWTHSIRKRFQRQALEALNTGNTDRSTDGKPAKRDRLSQRKMDQLNELHFVWNLQSYAWDRRYEQLVDFRAIHGHCFVPSSASACGFAGLFDWVCQQRRAYWQWKLQSPHKIRGSTSTIMTEDRYEALTALDFDWGSNPGDAMQTQYDTWQTQYDKLKEFYQQYGHSNVPTNYVAYPTLFSWCQNQRTAYKKKMAGESSPMSKKRIRLMEELEFRWSFRHYKWQSRLDRLKVYYQEHGHVDIATSDNANRDLRFWLTYQRYHYNRMQDGKSSLMTTDRVTAMESAIPNFSWKIRGLGISTEDWTKLFDAMRDKGIRPGMRAKQHWFEGMNPFSVPVKEFWSEQDLLDLWNQEEDDDDMNDDDGKGGMPPPERVML